jgi:hypothetical protein
LRATTYRDPPVVIRRTQVAVSATTKYQVGSKETIITAASDFLFGDAVCRQAAVKLKRVADTADVMLQANHEKLRIVRRC